MRGNDQPHYTEGKYKPQRVYKFITQPLTQLECKSGCCCLLPKSGSLSPATQQNFLKAEHLQPELPELPSSPRGISHFSKWHLSLIQLCSPRFCLTCTSQNFTKLSLLLSFLTHPTSVSSPNPNRPFIHRTRSLNSSLRPTPEPLGCQWEILQWVTHQSPCFCPCAQSPPIFFLFSTMQEEQTFKSINMITSLSCPIFFQKQHGLACPSLDLVYFLPLTHLLQLWCSPCWSPNMSSRFYFRAFMFAVYLTRDALHRGSPLA